MDIISFVIKINKDELDFEFEDIYRLIYETTLKNKDLID